MGEAWSGEDAGGTGSDLGDGCCCDDGDDWFGIAGISCCGVSGGSDFWGDGWPDEDEDADCRGGFELAVHSRFKGSAAGELVLRGDWLDSDSELNSSSSV